MFCSTTHIMTDISLVGLSCGFAIHQWQPQRRWGQTCQRRCHPAGTWKTDVGKKQGEARTLTEDSSRLYLGFECQKWSKLLSYRSNCLLAIYVLWSMTGSLGQSLQNQMWCSCCEAATKVSISRLQDQHCGQLQTSAAVQNWSCNCQQSKN